MDRADAAELDAIFSGMAAEGLAVLEEAGVGRDSPGVTITHFMDLRHKGQGHEVTVEAPQHILASSDFAAMAEEFYTEHIAKFGHAHRHLPVELITCRTSVAAPSPGVPLMERASQGSLAEARRIQRLAYFQEAGGMVMTPVYDRYLLPHNVTLQGPAIIEERESAAVCGPSAAIRLSEHGALFIDIAPAAVSRQEPREVGV